MTKTEIQIRFADVDALGHVNNVNLQHYFDLGKSDFYRALGLPPVPSVSVEVYPVTAATQTDYLAQVRPDDNIYVETRLEKVGVKSMTLVQRIISRATGEVKAQSRSVMVAFDFQRQEAVEVPAKWRE